MCLQESVPLWRENAALRSQVTALQAHLSQQAAHLSTLQGDLADANAALEGARAAQRDAQSSTDAAVRAAIAREHATQEARNERVLELLRGKDDALAGWEARGEELAEEVERLSEALAEERDALKREQGARAEADRRLHDVYTASLVEKAAPGHHGTSPGDREHALQVCCASRCRCLCWDTAALSVQPDVS